MGFDLISINEGGNDKGYLDNLDEITVVVNGERKTVSVGDFIGVSGDPDKNRLFDTLGSPAERLKQITEQYQRLSPKKQVQGLAQLFLSKNHPFIDVLDSANKRWEEHVVPGDSSFTDPLRKAVVEKGYSFKDLAGSFSIDFNNPTEAVRKVTLGIGLFCLGNKGWSSDDVIDFIKAMDPNSGDVIASLYHDGKFPDQTYSGAMTLILPTPTTSAVLGK